MRSVIKGDKGEAKVIKELLKIKDEHYLINNLILLGDNSVSHQFDHILIRHNGIFVIETKNYYGDIKGTIDDGMWIKTFISRGKLHIEKFMNPIKQNNAHIRYLKKVLGRDLPFINIVVFVDNDISKLGIYSVMNLSQLVNRVSLWESDKTISSDAMLKIYNTLLSLEADIQSEDHVDNIKTLKKDRKNKREEYILVIEKGLCPICGNKVQMNKNVYICQKCKYKLVV